MTSAINPLLPATGAATTASVRDNFLAAKNEILQLQTDTGAAAAAAATADGKAVTALANAAAASSAAAIADSTANTAANVASNALAGLEGKANMTGATFSGSLLVNNPSTPFGYAAGAGGAVTQLTSRATAVTLNKATGQITTTGTSLSAAAEATFTLTNSAIGANDVIVCSLATAAGAGIILIGADSIANGSCKITYTNTSTASTTAVLKINFAVIKGAAA